MIWMVVKLHVISDLTLEVFLQNSCNLFGPVPALGERSHYQGWLRGEQVCSSWWTKVLSWKPAFFSIFRDQWALCEVAMFSFCFPWVAGIIDLRPPPTARGHKVYHRATQCQCLCESHRGGIKETYKLKDTKSSSLRCSCVQLNVIALKSRGWGP